jgi:tetratricopeptide (TPR) repeat protein
MRKGAPFFCPQAITLAVVTGWITGSMTGCTIQSSVSNHYLTGEKLWTEKNYPAAAAEFDRVVKESPNSALGLQALWRASTTRQLFLNEPEEALKGFELFLERAGDSDLAPQAQIEMGEIYFTKLARYDKAIEHYEKLLSSGKYGADDEAKFYYRIGRSHFRSHRLKKAIEWYEQGLKKHPDSPFSAKSKYDLANAWYALGETEKGGYQKALKIFQELQVQTKIRDHLLFVQSVFGEASTHEEMDDLELAYEQFKSIENDYPAPNVIKVRMIRLAERMKKKRK